MTKFANDMQATAVDASATAVPAHCDSFSALYDAVAGQLVKDLRAKFGNGPPEPEDLMQEAFRRLFEHPQFSDIENKPGFLWRTAVNMALTSKRSQTKHAAYEPDVREVFFGERVVIPSAQSVLEVKEQLDTICGVLEAMPERRRWTILLRRLDGLSITQIALRLGVSRNTASKHLAKADEEISMLFLTDED